MSPEIHGSQENLSPRPKITSGGDNDHKDGYPPKGYDQKKQALVNQEAKIKATENPDDQLEKELALADILPWVTDKLPDCKPHGLAAEACLNMQLEEHEAGDPEYKITDEEPNDIKSDVVRFIEEKTNGEKIVKNTESIANRKIEQKTLVAQSETQETEIPKQKNQLTAESAKTPKLEAAISKSQTGLAKEHTKEAAKEGDLATVKQLQANFNELRASKGTIGALKTLLGPDGVKTPEMKAIVQRVLNTATALIRSVNNPAFERILNNSQINLGASSPLIVFAGVLAASDKSDELTEEEKKTIRRIICQSEKDFKTGTDAQKIAHSKEQVIDPETGEVISEKYTHDGPNNMAELRPNLGTYMDGERMMIATKDGLVKKDVTGWSSEDIGMLAEVMDFHRFAEEKGITGFVESIANTHYDISGNAFNREKMIQTRQVISALVGMGEGYDGDVFNPEDKALLLTNQLRVLTNDDQTISWHNNESGTGKILQEVGFRDQDGKPNLDVISAFGSYMQDNLTKKTTKKDVQKHLHKLFPNKVEKPEEDEDGGKK